MLNTGRTTRTTKATSAYLADFASKTYREATLTVPAGTTLTILQERGTFSKSLFARTQDGTEVYIDHRTLEA